MRIHLIAPFAPSREERLRSLAKASLAPPLGLTVLASLTPPEVEVALTDENFAAVDFGQPADLVGITVATQTAPRAYELADVFRARGVKVVLGVCIPPPYPKRQGGTRMRWCWARPRRCGPNC